jgi:hypothetical protein
MVAVYIPVLQPAVQISTHALETYNLDYKTAFMLRALHACNEAKDSKITCLGTAVTYHRRCRNPLRMTKWTIILAQMVEVAEDATFTLSDLKSVAANWAAGLSCHLHGGQKDVAMATLGAVAAYRLAFPEDVVVPGAVRLQVEHFGLGLLDRFTETTLSSESGCEVPSQPAKIIEKSDAVSERPLSEGKGRIKQMKALLSLVRAVLQALELCLSIVLLYLSILLVCAGILQLLGGR